MAKRKRGSSDGGPGSGDWLNTYADMVTLLLTFFILLFSMSSLDAAKFNMLVRAFASDKDSSQKIIFKGEGEGEYQTGTSTGPQTMPQGEEDLEELADVYEYLKKRIEEENLSEKVMISQGENYVFIRFMDGMLFEPNSDVLKPADLQILDFVGYAIKAVQGKAEMIRIDGHTAEILEDPDYPVSDRKLSSDRANRVLMYFEDTIGIDGNKLYQMGFGKRQPIGDNSTEEGRSRNRRVEILISGENILTEQLDNIYEQLIEL